MKEIQITETEKLAELLGWSLESAAILNKELEGQVDVIHRALEAKGITDEKKHMQVFSKRLAQFLLLRYQAVVVTSDERVLGRNGDKDEPIFDGEDTKVFLDAGGHY